MSNCPRISARALLEYSQREGGLSQLSFHNLSRNSGTRTHQRFYKKLSELYPQALLFDEHALDLGIEFDAGCLELNGRCDLLLCPEEISIQDLNTTEFESEEVIRIEDLDQNFKLPMIIEVKTFAMSLEQIPEDGLEYHWAQARIYTALLYFNALDDICRGDSQAYLNFLRAKSHQIHEIRLDHNSNFPKLSVPYMLAYVSQEDLSSRFLLRYISLEKLADFLRETIQGYWAMLENTSAYQKRRDASIHALKFPYRRLRESQKLFMLEGLTSIQAKETLFAQVPTGSGKTMASLYPAIKAIGHKRGGRIFYVTAKESTRRVAEAALVDLRKKGLVLRSIRLTAKEKICLEKDLYCNTKLCPYAVNYYDERQKALRDLLKYEHIDAGVLQKVAKDCHVCPFEIGLDIALYCDLIIGDYNHVLDPRVRIDRFFNQTREHYSLLFDEAHNLPDRCREMYSLSLSATELKQVQASFELNHLPQSSALDGLLNYFESWRQAQLSKQSLIFLKSEEKEVPDDVQFVSQGDFFAIRSPLDSLSQRFRTALRELYPYFDADLDNDSRRKLLDFFAKARFYLRICDEFWHEGYLLAFRAQSDDAHLRLICLDPSEEISKLFEKEHAALFFSATLTPFNYFKTLILEDPNQARELILPSPFPIENQRVLVYSAIKTRYRERSQYYAKIARAIAASFAKIARHQLVFFPSFAFLREVEALLRHLMPSNSTIISQKPSMNAGERQAFLDAFTKPAHQDQPLLGLAVLGGIFGEGIDLRGRALNAVIIVGVGIPGISPERNLMMDYYDYKFDKGYFYAYLAPGFNKVRQAAGRLIRSAGDCGMVLLMDERYLEAEYQELFPDEWKVEHIPDEDSLDIALDSVANFISDVEAFEAEHPELFAEDRPDEIIDSPETNSLVKTEPTLQATSPKSEDKRLTRTPIHLADLRESDRQTIEKEVEFLEMADDFWNDPGFRDS
ncbi:MAG: helicase C-terminal domain-containing protein [Eubacteriales bacterium]|nr:helicase C-terminal domain-containing protein [Eubacteriales bacterium]